LSFSNELFWEYLSKPAYFFRDLVMACTKMAKKRKIKISELARKAHILNISLTGCVDRLFSERYILTSEYSISTALSNVKRAYAMPSYKTSLK
jgi:hypothetical protein